MFKSLLPLALVLSGACHAQPAEVQHYYIFGDSLSSPTRCEWPLQLKGAVHNFAQAGLTLKDYDLPHHFYSRPGGIGIIYIGTNDAARGYGAQRYKQHLQELVSKIRFRGIVQVYIIGQPYLDIFTSEITAFRTVTIEVAEEVSAVYLDPMWGADSTSDGVHPTCMNNAYLGYWIQLQIDGENYGK